MTDDELWDMHAGQSHRDMVTVIASDYQYDGWLRSVFEKRSGAVRCAVEDANGRLFIHNAGQIHRRT